MRLILLRHAKTESKAASGEDFDRALTGRGLSDAALMGRVLSGAGLIPDRVLVSAAKRSVQTWEAAAPALPDAHVEIRRDLYAASADALRAAALKIEDAKVVMVVAHNPGVQALAQQFGEASTLIQAELRAKLALGFPSAAAAAFDLDQDRIGCLGLFTPREHGGGDRGEDEGA